MTCTERVIAWVPEKFSTACKERCQVFTCSVIVTMIVAWPRHISARGVLPRQDGATPLYIAAWNGHAALVRWLLNHGAEPTARDGLNQTPIEIAGSHEVKRILGAARGVIDLNDKVELIGYDAAQSINDVGAKLRLQLERMGGRMGEIEQDIENAAQRHAQAEVMELRAALGRKIDKELHTFYKQIKKEMKL